ncbi:hypothetical protein AB5J62_38410 [Amycolatopsis sp. cg5]|uniref:hypothetical protein n=1 Tax=Amycolatopsis sp. cg5 TaxID=3238802 RepID=UPI0035237A6A
MAKKSTLVAAVSLAIVAAGVSAAPASAGATAVNCWDGANCVYYNGTLVDSWSSVMPGECHRTAVYDTIENRTVFAQRIWENDNCTGNSVIVWAGTTRWTSTLRRSIGGV